MSNISQQTYDIANEWLESLGMLCCGTMSADEAKLKCSSYCGLIVEEFPVESFCQNSLSFVAKRCKFFPGFGEVCDHLAAWFREALPAFQRLGANPAHPSIARMIPNLRPPSDEDNAYVDACVAVMKAALEAKEVGQSRARVNHRYGSKLELALSAPPEVLAIRPDLRAVLAEVEAQQEARQ